MGFCLFKIATVEKAYDSALLLPKKPPKTKPPTHNIYILEYTGYFYSPMGSQRTPQISAGTKFFVNQPFIQNTITYLL